MGCPCKTLPSSRLEGLRSSCTLCGTWDAPCLLLTLNPQNTKNISKSFGYDHSRDVSNERMKCSSCCNSELPSLRAGRGSSEAGRVEMFVTLGWYLSNEGREASSSRSLGRSSAPWANNRPRGPRQQQRGITFQKHWQLFMAREGTAHQQRCRDHAQVALTGFLLNLQQILAEFANSSN